MEPKPKGLPQQDLEVKFSESEAELELHRLMGAVMVDTTPEEVGALLMRNAANDVPLTPEWKAFLEGVHDVDQIKPE